MPKHHAIHLLTGIALIGFGAASCDDVPPPTTRDNEAPSDVNIGTVTSARAEQQILQTVHENNLQKIAVGRMAQERGESEAVRAYGERLVTAHTTNDEELRALTEELDIALSQPVEETDAEGTLEALQGEEFDTRFATLMRQGYSSLVQNVEAARTQVRDEQVEAFLAKTMPVLRLQMAPAAIGAPGEGSSEGNHAPQGSSGGG